MKNCEPFVFGPEFCAFHQPAPILPSETSHSHAEQAGRIMLQLKILVGKGLSTIDACTTRTVTVQEVTSLDHEIADLITYH